MIVESWINISVSNESLIDGTMPDESHGFLMFQRAMISLP